MSDEFFRKAFGDDEPVHIGSGWISGVCGVFLGLLALGGTLCLRFPEILTLPEARAKYPIAIMRVLIQGSIFAAFAFAAASAVMRQRKVLALTGAASPGGWNQVRNRPRLVPAGPVRDDLGLRSARADLAAASRTRDVSSG